jgi:hypothetical protein
MPVAISLLITPVCLAITDALIKQEPIRTSSIILLPYAVLSVYSLYSFILFIPLAIIQYPIYGVILGRGSYNGRLARECIRIAAAHVLTIGLLYLIPYLGSIQL